MKCEDCGNEFARDEYAEGHPWHHSLAGCFARMKAQLATAREANAELRGLMEELQWHHSSSGAYCPACYRCQSTGHMETCRIGQALAAPQESAPAAQGFAADKCQRCGQFRVARGEICQRCGAVEDRP